MGKTHRRAGTAQAGGGGEVPELLEGVLQLRPPPRLQQSEGAGGVVMTAVPALGSLGSIVLVVTMSGSSTGGRHYLAAGMFLLTTLGFVAAQLDRQRRQRGQQVSGTRADYLHHLADVRRAAREAAGRQRQVLTWHHPDPDALPAVAAERTRVWERGSDDPHFLHVRYGVTEQALPLELVAPDDTSAERVDPVAASALRRLLAVHRRQEDLPAWLDLRAVARIELAGSREPAQALARALVCAAAAFHSPTSLAVAVLTTDGGLSRWDWVKWLPHVRSARLRDGIGARRMVATSPVELAALLPVDLAERPRFGADERSVPRHLLLVLDVGDETGAGGTGGHHVLPVDGVHGVTVLHLGSTPSALPDAMSLRLELGPPEDAAGARAGRPRMELRRAGQELARGRADQCSLVTAEAVARRLTPLAHGSGGPSGGDPGGALATDPGLAALLGLGDVDRLDPAAAWRPRAARDRLRVPLGTDGSGAVVHLDLKEAAQQGAGPHGLVVGATGSGKSELLRTIVLGLAMTHSPEHLNLVLVDFKGGATFAGMSRLPHVSALITNLAQELALVDRMQDALAGELVRRQQVLREAGELASVREHERARASGRDLPPLPSLVVVVDEFSELLTARPEFADLFVAIGRLGRSLGVHLLLASQRLDEGRLRGLESHLSYRIALRTFSAHESRAVLGVADAYELPPVPGLAYLQTDPTTTVRFRSAYVSGPVPARVRDRGPAGPQPRPGVLPFTVAEVASPAARDEPSPGHPVPPPSTARRSLLEVAVARLARHGPAAHRVWLPPLDVPDTLDALAPDLAVDPALGLVSADWRAVGRLVLPLGTVDRPSEQRRETLTVDLRGSAGHLAVVGGPRSGKSTVLRTVVAAAALTSTPLETQVYVLDLGGGSFGRLAGLPHVAGVATRGEPDVVRRVVAEVTGVLAGREAYFRDHGIDSLETYLTRRAGGSADDGWGEVVLVVDGWSTLRADFEDLEGALQELCARGLAFGVHVIAATGRWSDFRTGVRDLFGSRVELRLGDPLDSEVDRRAAARVPPDRPGQGLSAEGAHVLAALPRIDSDTAAATLDAGVQDLVRRVAEAWRGPSGPKLRLLPSRVLLQDVRARAAPTGRPAADDRRRLLLGLDERRLAPVWLDPDDDPHLLVLGEGRSGKTATLRGLLCEIVRTRTPQEAQVVLVDPRRSLLGEVPDDHLLGHLTGADRTEAALRDLATDLAGRLPGPTVGPDQLRSRSWWRGAEVFVLVDDYDLVVTPRGSPLAPLQPLLPQARDVGLHLVVARRVGGASRALYEPVLQSLRDLAAPGLLLSGSPDEGPLLGGLRAVPAPPGRARLVTRERGVEVVQAAWTEPRY